jgi:hypothetical protein
MNGSPCPVAVSDRSESGVAQEKERRGRQNAADPREDLRQRVQQQRQQQSARRTRGGSAVNPSESARAAEESVRAVMVRKE